MIDPSKAKNKTMNIAPYGDLPTYSDTYEALEGIGGEGGGE